MPLQKINFRTLPKVTLSLILISLWVALISQQGQNIIALQPFFISWYVDNGLSEISQGQWWRLVSPIFIHFGWMHLTFNCIMTWQLGDLIERYLGTLKFLLLVIVIAIFSNLAQFYASGPSFGGLSGVVYGLFGYFWMASYFDPHYKYRINPSAVKILMAWFVLCWFNFFGLLGDIQIANIAHTIGLITGMAWGASSLWRARLFARRQK